MHSMAVQQHWAAARPLWDRRSPVWLHTSLNTMESLSQNRKLETTEEANSLQEPPALQVLTHQKPAPRGLHKRVKAPQFRDTRPSERKQYIKSSPGASIYFEPSSCPDTLILLHTVMFPPFSCHQPTMPQQCQPQAESSQGLSWLVPGRRSRKRAELWRKGYWNYKLVW